MIVINPLGSSGVSLSYIAQTNVGTGDVRTGKKFIYPSGKIATGTGHILAIKSGSISCSTTSADTTINTGLKSISAFILFQSYRRPSSTTRYTMVLYGQGFNFCAIASDGTPNKEYVKGFSVSGGNVTIERLYYPDTHSGLYTLPWLAVGYTE